MVSATLAQSVSPTARCCGLRNAGGISTEIRTAANIARCCCVVTRAFARWAWTCRPYIPCVRRTLPSWCDRDYISYVTLRTAVSNCQWYINLLKVKEYRRIIVAIEARERAHPICGLFNTCVRTQKLYQCSRRPKVADAVIEAEAEAVYQILKLRLHLTGQFIA